MAGSQRSTEPASTWQDELLRVLLRQSGRVMLPVFLTALVIAGMAYDGIPAWILAGWLALVAAMLVIRRLVLARVARSDRLTPDARLRVAAALTALVGVTHGMSAGFFPFLPDVERALLCVWLVGACAASVVTTAGYLPVFLSYFVPVLGPVVAMWALRPGIAQHAWVEPATAVLTLFLGGLLVSFAKDTFRLFRESFEIRHQQRELTRQLELTLAQAEAANRAKTKFLASASHDLRQPTHTVSLFAAALSMRPLDDESREIVRHVNSAIQVLAAQLDALLDISKLDAGIVRANVAPLRLDALLERLERDFAPAAHAKGVDVAVRCAGQTWVASDAILLERIIRNLLDNAVKYTDSGRIELRVESSAERVAVMISDTGRGIPKEEQQRVFEEFYQLENPERDRAKGLGLGLAIVRRLADLLQIPLEMTSAPAEGTRFRIELRREHAGEAPAAEAPAASVPPALRVLVIDDEAEIRLGMKTLLESMGCRTMVADGTAAALAAAAADRPDVVVADLRLRGADNGIDAVRAVRGLYPRIPALLISGDIASDRLREAERAGIALLHKPVPAEALKRAIAEAVAA